jgi:hypothetical protein
MDNQPLMITCLDVLSCRASIKNRVNEDAFLVLESIDRPRAMIVAVMDGVSMRVLLPPFLAYLEKNYPGLTPAAFATQYLRTNLISQFYKDPRRSLRDVLLNANSALRKTIGKTMGGFDPVKILAEANRPLGDDMRNVRMMLPACVITLARLDLVSRRLDYAHLGDTNLIEIFRNGEAIRHTADQMGPFDSMMLQTAANIQIENQLPHFQDAVMLPEVRELNLRNRLRHNYVNARGHTDRQEGTGVINGLPQAEDYIDTGSIAVDPSRTVGFLLLTDGLELFPILCEQREQSEQRIRQIARLVRESGLRGLYDAVRKMAQGDPLFDQYPRVKYMDDATGIYIEITPPEG